MSADASPYNASPPRFLSGPYFPDHSSNRMSGEGDAISARNIFFEQRLNNLVFLLERRYA